MHKAAAPGLRTSGALGWARALAPLLLVAGLVVLLLRLDLGGGAAGIPPIEVLTFERTVLRPDVIELTVRNTGPAPVRIAQVQVEAAYWAFEATSRDVPRLQTSTLTVPYPWEAGLPLEVAVVTATGATAVHAIEAAALTPAPGAASLRDLSLVGLLMGLVPVGIGLLWLPALRRARPATKTFALAFTLGLLVFLLVETVEEGVALAGRDAAALGGVGVFAIGALVAGLALATLDARLAARSDGDLAPLTLAALVAAGIGLHNLGEGLVVGAALGAGEAALGTVLVLGFALHNVSEGIAIAAPIDDAPPVSGARLAWLAVLAGLPALPGVYAGSFASAPWLATLVLGLAAGAVGQVLWAIGGGMVRRRTLVTGPGVAGLLAGFVVMLATGLLVTV